VSLPSTLVFDFPTIEKMSAILQEKIVFIIHSDHPKAVWLPLIPISQSGITHFKLSSAQKRTWFMYELNQKDTSYNISIDTRLNGKILLPFLQKAFDTVVARHAIFRTT
jgi:hypothetical protein